MRLLVGTKNPGKLKEIGKFLGEGFELVSLPDLPDVDETGTTFEENAILKAKAYFTWSGIPTVAEDGGLAIDALNGEPGVYSRRWPTADELKQGVSWREKTDEELIGMALTKMADVPEGRRTAHLIAVGVYYDGERLFTETASIPGVIAMERAQEVVEGLPFRSIFFVPQFGRFYKDLTHEEHEAVNQRKTVYSKLGARILRKG